MATVLRRSLRQEAPRIRPASRNDLCLVLRHPRAQGNRRKAVGSVIEAKLESRPRAQSPPSWFRTDPPPQRQLTSSATHSAKSAPCSTTRTRHRRSRPLTPVEVLGLESMPTPATRSWSSPIAQGQGHCPVPQMKERDSQLAKSSRVSLEGLAEQIRNRWSQGPALIIKGDVTGSVEVLADSLPACPTEKVRIKVIHSGVGSITESDVLLATASNTDHHRLQRPPRAQGPPNWPSRKASRSACTPSSTSCRMKSAWP